MKVPKTISVVAEAQTQVALLTINSSSPCLALSTIVLLFSKFWPVSDLIITRISNWDIYWSLLVYHNHLIVEGAH